MDDLEAAEAAHTEISDALAALSTALNLKPWDDLPWWQPDENPYPPGTQQHAQHRAICERGLELEARLAAAGHRLDQVREAKIEAGLRRRP